MIEYYISRVKGDNFLFKVTKFAGDAQPENIYFVKMVRKRALKLPEMHCDCPNRRRDKHINDKHGVMVTRWLLAGEKPGYFNDKGEFHEQRQPIATDLERELAGEEWDNQHASDANAKADNDPDEDKGDEENDQV